MSLNAFRSGCNVIAFKFKEKKYGMVCAWATMIDYDKIGMLIGSQSVTGKLLSKGDYVGVSALAEGQEEIAKKLGENHSNDGDKFDGVETLEFEDALFIKGSKVKMLCTVLKIERLVDQDDKFVVLQIVDSNSDKNKKFLGLEDVYPEE